MKLIGGGIQHCRMLPFWTAFLYHKWTY